MSADNSNSLDAKIHEATSGNAGALRELLADYEPRLRRMVDLHIDSRVQRKISPAEVVQQAYAKVNDKLDQFSTDGQLPFFLWVRQIVARHLTELHSEHLSAENRRVALEISLHRGRLPQASSFALASKLIGNSTATNHDTERIDRRVKLQAVLNSMDPEDREVLSMRHFEELSNPEVATILEVSESVAGMRFLRALRRLKQELRQVPQIFPTDTGDD